MSQRHHFVPKILINGFLDPASIDELGRNPFTWIYEKEKKVSKKKSPDNILWERNLYTQYDERNNENHSLEQFFSQKLEYPFAQFKKDHENSLLSMDRSALEKSNFSHLRMFFVAFIFWHWKRSFKFISRVKESYKQELLKNDGAEILVDYIDSKAMQNDILDTLINIGNLYENQNAMRILAKRNIIFTVITNEKSSFINSDNPVLRTNATGPNGFSYPSTEVSMPLTSKIAISLIGENQKIQFRALHDRKEIRRINQSFAMNADKYIFGRNKELIDSLSKYIGEGGPIA